MGLRNSSVVLLYMQEDLGLAPDIHVQSHLQPQHYWGRQADRYLEFADQTV